MHAHFIYRNLSYDVAALQNLSNKQDKHCTYSATSSRVRVPTVRGNALSIKYYECISYAQLSGR